MRSKIIDATRGLKKFSLVVKLAMKNCQSSSYSPKEPHRDLLNSFVGCVTIYTQTLHGERLWGLCSEYTQLFEAKFWTPLKKKKKEQVDYLIIA